MAGEERDLPIIQVHAVHGNQSRTEQAGFFEALQWPHAMLRRAVGDFLRGFVNVSMHGNIQLAGIGGDLREGGIRYREWRMWRQTERQQRFIAQCITQGHASGQVILGVIGVG